MSPADLPPTEPPPDDELLQRAFFRDSNVADIVPDDDPGPSVLRRLLPRVLGVLLLLAILDVVLRVVLPAGDLVRHMSGERAQYTVKVERFAGSPAPDVLFLGSSRVRDGIVPAVFDAELSKHWERPARSFNLGLVNAKAEEYYSLAAAHLPDPAPEYVVIGITGSEIVGVHNFQYAAQFLWRRPQASAYLERTEWALVKSERLEQYADSALGRAWYLFGQREVLEIAATRAFRRATGLASDKEIAAWERTGDLIEHLVTVPDGYFHSQADNEDNLEALLLRDPKGVRVPPRELVHAPEIVHGGRFELLREIVATLEARGSKVALVEMPTSPYLQDLNPVLHGGGIPPEGGRGGRLGFRQRVTKLAEELGVVFVPFPKEESFLSNKLYLDVNHLSSSGARRFTRVLFLRLRDSGFFEEPGS